MANTAYATDGTITSADTTRHAFPGSFAGILYARARTGNGGTVTIGAAGGTGGVPLAAGDWAPPLNITDLTSLAYQFSSGSGDHLDYLVVK